jgi:hypothetical protein
MDFVKDLWSSILTPGTNEALLKATHGSFAALLITLVALLVATRNIHYVFLTLIAAGLWASITWFVAEVEREKQRQKENGESEKPATEATKASGKEETQSKSVPAKRASKKT